MFIYQMAIHHPVFTYWKRFVFKIFTKDLCDRG